MPNAYNTMLGFPNRIDEAVLSGGSFEPALGLDNLKKRLFARVARTTDAAKSSTQFVIDLGSPKKIRLLALIAHTISLGGRWRAEASNDADFTTLRHDTGFRSAWGSLQNGSWNINDLEWESDNYWLGTYSAEEIEGFTATSVRILPKDIIARHWRISIDDDDNLAGHIDIGRVFIGPALQPQINRAWGSTFGWESNTAVETALGGAEFFDRREPYRVFGFQLQFMKDDEAYGTFLELQRRAGVHAEVLAIPDPTDTKHSLRRNFMGRLRQMSLLEEAMWANGGSAHNLSFEIKELR